MHINTAPQSSEDSQFLALNLPFTQEASVLSLEEQAHSYPQALDPEVLWIMGFLMDREDCPSPKVNRVLLSSCFSLLNSSLLTW